VILGASIIPFTTPQYVRAEQDRTGVPQLTGYSSSDLDGATGAILGDLLLWRGDFDVAVAGTPVLTEREIGHMRDVRGVFAGLWLLVGAAAATLAVVFWRSRGDEAQRAGVWLAISRGARALLVTVVVLGIFAALAFEAAFEVFHRLFFSTGSYTFDPVRDRLVQLFPQAFWSETTMFLGVVLLAVAAVVAWMSHRRGRAALRRIPAYATEAAGAG
jgi:integral membrane protein (TIGR01906 family)